jgi:hypothetical protein
MSEEAHAPGGWRFTLKVEDGVVFARIYDAADDFVARIVDGVSGVEAHRWALQQIASWATSFGSGEVVNGAKLIKKVVGEARSSAFREAAEQAVLAIGAYKAKHGEVDTHNACAKEALENFANAMRIQADRQKNA